MIPYPVHYGVERPTHFTRLQLAARVIAFCALGVLGLSFGMVFVFAYLALPVYAATRLSAGREPAAYVTEDGPRVLRGLRWLAAISAWAGLIVEHLPVREASEAVKLEIEGTAHPVQGRALWRVFSGIPSALVLCLLCWFGVFVWLWAALSILVTQRIGDHTFHYLEGLQRWSIRLLAYQASLVDEYPPFSFSDAPAVLPPARVAH